MQQDGAACLHPPHPGLATAIHPIAAAGALSPRAKAPAPRGSAALQGRASPPAPASLSRLYFALLSFSLPLPSLPCKLLVRPSVQLLSWPPSTLRGPPHRSDKLAAP